MTSVLIKRGTPHEDEGEDQNGVSTGQEKTNFQQTTRS